MGNRVSEIRFVPVEGAVKDHVGFVDFTLDGEMAFKDAMVYKDHSAFKVVYRKHPKSDRYYVHPVRRTTSFEINDAITKYLKEKGV